MYFLQFDTVLWVKYTYSYTLIHWNRLEGKRLGLNVKHLAQSMESPESKEMNKNPVFLKSRLVPMVLPKSPGQAHQSAGCACLHPGLLQSLCIFIFGVQYIRDITPINTSNGCHVRVSPG